MLARDLPEGALYQMVPYRTPGVVRRFLSHFRPDMAVWVESELLPRMLVATERRGVPMCLINARVSARTARRWLRFAGTAQALLAPFREAHVQEQVTLDAIRAVGVDGPVVRLTGTLKEDREPPGPDPEKLARPYEGDRRQACWH
jgi:3-deoxy-D-manno-octulosonic-acid transferase